MAAYERALLLICQHTTRMPDPQKPLNFDFLLEVGGLSESGFLGYTFLLLRFSFVQAKKELAIAEGFKQDYNFLWRLLGRVHAARAAIQGLMGEEVK